MTTKWSMVAGKSARLFNPQFLLREVLQIHRVNLQSRVAANRIIKCCFRRLRVRYPNVAVARS